VSAGDRPEKVTVWIIPEGGAGPSRRLELSTATLRRSAMLLAVVAALVGLITVVGVAGLPRALAYESLAAENIELKGRLLEVEGKLDTVDRELRRLRLYEEQLHAIDPEDLPGFGPMADAVTEGPSDLSWFSEGIEVKDTGLSGEPLDDLGEEELVETASVHDRLDLADQRADAVLRQLRLAEIELGQVVETAEGFRSQAGAIPSAWPLEGVLTSGFGWRRSPFNKRWKFHFGIDVSAPIGTVIRAPAAGLVVTAEYHSGYGRMLEVDHGYDVVTRYAHNSRLLVGVGETVQAGQPISTVGMTGATTGPHLHYEIYVDGQPVDPLEHLE
jgi:murein DD-endopeptidase MepM/ murein hydrolase activator NlpD